MDSDRQAAPHLERDLSSPTRTADRVLTPQKPLKLPQPEWLEIPRAYSVRWLEYAATMHLSPSRRRETRSRYQQPRLPASCTGTRAAMDPS